MSQRIALLNWKNKNQDYDVSKILQSLVVNWVVEGLKVVNWKVWVGYAFIEVERNGIKFYVLFTNSEEVVINTAWTSKVFIEVNQAKVDDWKFNNPDGTEIWEIKVAGAYPSSNYIKLASITNWVITDERKFVNLKWLTRTWLTPNSLTYINAQWKEQVVPFTSANNWMVVSVDSVTWISYIDAGWNSSKVTLTAWANITRWTPVSIGIDGKVYNYSTIQGAYYWVAETTSSAWQDVAVSVQWITSNIDWFNVHEKVFLGENNTYTTLTYPAVKGCMEYYNGNIY